MIDGPIFDPAAGKAGEPENDAGEGGEHYRSAAERMEGFDGILRGIGSEKRRAHGELPENTENDRSGADREDVAQRGGELGAEDPLDVGDELVHLGSVAAVVDDAGQGGAGHGGLLGG